MALTQIAFMSYAESFPDREAVTEDIVPTETTAATTIAANTRLKLLRVATDTAVYISIGPDPDAETDSNKIYLLANTVEYFKVNSGDKVAVAIPAAEEA